MIPNRRQTMIRFIKEKVFRKSNAPEKASLNAPAEDADQKHEAAEKNGTLLVIGRESAFTHDVIDYAVDMADRLSYDILALNTAPLSCETFKLFSSSRNKVCQDFQRISEENARAFASRAAQKHIRFDHVVKFSEIDQAIDEVRREQGKIDFVISDLDESFTETQAEQGARAHREIYVYSMI
jgi:hypothetical protein